jgi:lysophospholipase L1-like esterase
MSFEKRPLLKTGILLVAFLVTLELILRVLGFSFSTYQEWKNFGNDPRPVLVTLGESTTADSPETSSWPRQLEKLLEAQGTPFKVVNLAQAGTTSVTQLNHLLENFSEKPPHMIVAMMGINDNPELWPARSGLVGANSFFANLKIVKVFRWATHPQPPPVLQPDSLSYPDIYSLMTQIKEDKTAADKEIARFLSSQSPDAAARFYAYVGNLIFEQNIYKEMLSQEIAIEYLKKSIELSTFIPKVIEHTAHFWNSHNMRVQCEWMAQKLTRQPSSVNEAAVRSLVECLFPEKTLTEKIVQIYGPGMRYEETDIQYPTFEVFEKIARFMEKEKRCVIAMKYPIKPMRLYTTDLLELRSSYFYVLSNDPIFEKALREFRREYIFTDSFAGEFGHATDHGNSLIAQGVLNKINELKAANACDL